ncbi:MAG: peptidase M2 family protein, partial [Alphaproteobacteria bacterium]
MIRMSILVVAACMALPAWSGKSAELSPEAAAARAFVAETSARLKALWMESAQAAWAKATNITEETIAAETAASAKVLAAEAEAVREAARFNDVETDADTRRQLEILKTMSSSPAPRDPEKVAELAAIMSRMEAIYGAGKVCDNGRCRDLQELTRVMAESRDADELLAAWVGWRTVSPEIRPLYQRFVALTREGARQIGFDDLGALWRSGYDMTPEQFADEVERLWAQVAPLY